LNNQTPPSAAPALDRGLSMIEYLLEINQPASLKKNLGRIIDSHRFRFPAD